MGLWDVDSPDFDYRKNGYEVHSGVSASGGICDAVVCTKENTAIAISLIHGNLQGKLENTFWVEDLLKLCYNICVVAKSKYRSDFGSNFSVSAKAMAVELAMHAVPECLSKIVEKVPFGLLDGVADEIHSHTKFADIGVNDGMRVFDDAFEVAYNVIV